LRWRTGALACVALVLAGASAFLATGSPRADWPPDFPEVRAAHRPSEARLLDRAGRVLHERRVDLRVRRLPWTPLERISPALR